MNTVMSRLYPLLGAAFLIATFSTAAIAEVLVVEPAVNSGKEADFQRAKAASKDAKQAFADDKFTSALAHAESAYRTYPNASTAIQMATIHARLDHAKDAYRWLLVARNHNPVRAIVSRIDKGLKKHGAIAKFRTVLLKTTPNDATISINGGAAIAKGGSYVGLSFGEHTLAATAANHHPASQTAIAKAAGMQTVNFKLEAMAVVPAADPESADITVPLALVISGAVVAGAGAGLLVWGLSSNGDANGLNGSFASGQTADDAADEFNGLKGNAEIGTYAGYGLLGLGGALIVTGAVLWAILPGGTEGEGSADVVATPALLPGGGGMVLHGSF